jgi:hypothetical protein
MFQAEFFEERSLLALHWARTRRVEVSTAALAVCVVAGVWLRCRGMFGENVIPMWDDEVAWVIRLMREPLSSHVIRPIGFMAFSKLMAELFGPSETALRLLPWAASIGALLLSVRLGRQLLTRTGQVLLVAIIAFHPDVIDLGREYKHYSLSLFVHVSLATLALSYVRDGRRRWLTLTLAAAFVAVLFTQDAVFAYPGVYLVLAWTAFEARRYRHLVAIGLGAGLTLSVLLGFYWFVWRHLNAGGGTETEYWGQKYDVFYLPSQSHTTHWQWLLEKYGELAAYPGARRALWKVRGLVSRSMLGQLRSMDAAAWIVVHVLGLGVIALRRQRNEALLFVLPLVVLTIFNVLGFWPFGEFRTNLFVVLYMAVIAGFAMSAPSDHRSARRTLAPALVFVALPLLGFERGWHRRKESVHTSQTAFPLALRTLTSLASAYPGAHAEPLVLDASSCGSWRYYVTLHPDYEAMRGPLRQRFRSRCTYRDHSPVDLARNELRHKHRVWFLILDREGIDRFWASSLEGLRVVEKATPDRHTFVGSLERDR